MWVKKMQWYTLAVEHYSDIRKDKILPLAKTRMDLENIMLSEISQTEEVKNQMISLLSGI